MSDRRQGLAVAADGKTEAAVLVPVFRSAAGEPTLVLVRRREGGAHGGQLAFPGGKRETGDGTMLAAALRETEEEIGVSPGRVEVLADLPEVETRTTGYRVFPFLARLAPPSRWRPAEDEIAEVLEVGIEELARPESHRRAVETFPTWDGPREVPYYRVGRYRLWGLTYRILEPLLPRLVAGEWRI